MQPLRAGRARLRAAAIALALVALLLPAGAGAQALPALPYDDAAYWSIADRMQARLDDLWDESASMYRAAGPDVGLNANLLLGHAMAALAGHDGPARNDHRARALTLRFLTSPTYMTRPGSGQAHAPGWSGFMHAGGGQHLVFDSDVMDALAYVYRARDALRLPAATVDLLRDHVRAVARGRFWRFPTIRLNQFNWFVLVAAANATVNGADRTLAHDTAARLAAFLDGAGPRGAAAGNFGPGLRFHYLPHLTDRARSNLDSAEYANIVMGFTRFYVQARRAGMPPPSARRLRLMRAWVRRVITGYWTHSGYLNWDTGLGFHRWHQGKKFGLAQQALIGIAASPGLQPGARYGRWAKTIFDRGVELFDRWTVRGGGLAPALAFGVHVVPQSRASAQLAAARFIGNLSRAVDAGLGRIRGEAPPALYAYDPDIGRLAITTPAYNTAIVAVNQRAFPYGGIELARLLDSRQEAAGGIGGIAPASFGVWVRDMHGHRLLASQTGRTAIDRSYTPLRLVRAPSGVGASSSSPVGRAYSGTFRELRAVGERAVHGFRVVTRHRFTPRYIDERWEVTGPGRRGHVDVLFPSTGRADARVVAVMRDGSRRVLNGLHVPLSDVDRFVIHSRSTSYVVKPLSRPAGATAHTLHPAPQSSAPDPGPTLAIQIVRAGAVRRASFAARLRVRR